MARPQLFHVGQFVQIAQTEMIKKKLRGFVKKRAAGNFGPSGNFDEAAFHQCLQHPIDVHAAHGFDIGARNWLAIRDDRERLQRRRGQARRFGHGKKLAHPAGKCGIRDELPAFRFLDNLKRALLLNILYF